MSTLAVTCAQNQRQKHHTNLKHLLQQTIAHQISDEMLKNLKKSLCFSSNLRTKSMMKYTSYKNLGNLLRQLLSCKISYKTQSNNLKNLPSSTVTAFEVYRKQENVVKDLLPQSRCTHKINDKM